MKLGTGVIGGLPKAEVVGTGGHGNSSSPLNSLTLSGASLGVAHSSRQIIVIVSGQNANIVSDSNYTTAVTVGGVSATRKISPVGSVNSHTTVWITPRQDNGGPTGTTGNVVATRSTGNGYTRVTFLVFAAYKLKTSEPHDFLSTVGTTTVNILGGGIVTCMGAGSSVNGGFTWTNATEFIDFTTGVGAAFQFSGAVISESPAATAFPITASQSAGTFSTFAASWR